MWKSIKISTNNKEQRKDDLWGKVGFAEKKPSSREGIMREEF